jgi:hypothetical protein
MHVRVLKQKRERRWMRWFRILKKNRRGHHQRWTHEGRDAIECDALEAHWAPRFAELARIQSDIDAIRAKFGLT